jgi:hypothetical protein
MHKTPEKASYVWLQVTVVVGAALLVFSHWFVGPNRRGYDIPVSEGSAKRNERSTPRSFILPATPGVAFEQERRRSDTTNRNQLTKCIGMLRGRGFQVGQNDALLNAKLVEALYTFQIKHGLSASGQLDTTTMQKLECF